MGTRPHVLALEVRAPDFHQDEVVVAASGDAVASEAGLFEATLGAHVPVQRLQVNPVEAKHFEQVARERPHEVGAVAPAPVLPQPDRNADLGLAAPGLRGERHCAHARVGFGLWRTK